MKQFILSIIICLCGIIPTQAKVVKDGNVFKTEKSTTLDEFTGYYYEIDGVNYMIFRTKNNSFYVNRISKKTGKYYKHYLPKEVQEQLKQLFV